MSGWTVSDGTSSTSLPASLEPLAGAYLPEPEFFAFRPPGGTSQHYDGDGLPAGAFLELGNGVLTGSPWGLAAALATATTLTRVEEDGELTWDLVAGRSHVTRLEPIEGRSDYWALSVRAALASVLPARVFALFTEAGLPITSEDGLPLVGG